MTQESYIIFGLEQTVFIVLIAVVLPIALFLIFFFSGLTYVKKNNVIIVEKKKKYFKTLNAGFRFVIPLVQSVQSYVRLTGNIIDGDLIYDNYRIFYSITFNVNDPKEFAYNRQDINAGLLEALTNSINKKTVKFLVDNKKESFLNIFRKKSEKINSIEVSDFSFVIEANNG